ncbi:PREDICTED: leucine-rich repeat extensin-like protein 1 [Populus euphratica]|uniref:Leucine-rich repeat extensin-like protein 1 n=1 Tax=Populus euphratica TaxID=75702 RepID=A0AAJ6Y4F7_POPEU|nr:PREDICTED: leucine-rich repeat extensin-like protein 1 [Populus euphratica]
MPGVPFFIAKYQPPPFCFQHHSPHPFSLLQKSYEQQHQFLRILSPSLEIKMINPNSLSVSFLILFILHTDYFSSTTSNITGVSKTQCTMCSGCENPCQPLPSTPPPPPPVSTCPPPPAVVSGSPPPPSMPNSGTIYYSPPPPNSVPTYAYSPPPPPADVAGFYPPPRYGNHPAPPPPNPILPYFPFYYYNPPPSSSPNSVLLKMNPIVFFIFLFLSFLCCF